MRRPFLAILSLSLLLVGCGGASTPVPSVERITVSASSFPVVPAISSPEQAVGRDRIVFQLIDSGNEPITHETADVHLTFAPPADSDANPIETDASWLRITDEIGLWVAYPTYPVAGRWRTTFRVDRDDRTDSVTVAYDVRADGEQLGAGDPAPPVDNPTAADADGELKWISTDPSPDPRFYEVSIADALAAHEPFLAVFATPSFCRTQMCGPMLQVTKDAVARYPDLTAIHVEPYRLMRGPVDLQLELSTTGLPQLAPWAEGWHLIAEPFIAIVDGQGVIQAAFTGPVMTSELTEAIDAVLGPGPSPSAS